MIPFASIYARADVEIIQSIIGNQALRILSNFFAREKTLSSQIKKLILELFPPEAMLLKKELRNQFIDLMREKEVFDLIEYLNLRKNGNPYKLIQESNFNRGSEIEKKFFNFFELQPLPTEVAESLPCIKRIAPTYLLHSYQLNAIREIGEKLKEHPRRVILHMPTGSGKTRTAMNYISEFLRKNNPSLVVWLAHSEELCEQAIEEFEKAWGVLGDRDVNLFRYFGEYNVGIENLADGLMVGGLQKLYQLAKRSISSISQIGVKTSLVIMDEAHKAIAESYSLVINGLLVHNTRTALLGLTATPGRSYLDIGEDEKLARFFYRNKVTLNIEGYRSPIDYLTEKGYLAKINYTPLTHGGGVSISEKDREEIANGWDVPEKIIQKLADDEIRNLTILKKLKELSKVHKRIIFFAASISNSDLIAFLLRALEIEAHSITGTTVSSHRSRLISDFKSEKEHCIILCNFGILTTGFDAPKTSCVLIARPTTSLVLYSQMVGRAIRGPKSGGNDTAEVVTVIDPNLPSFGNQSDAFLHWEDIF